MSRESEWVQVYVDEVLNGHAGKTLELVVAARRAPRAQLAPELHFEQFCATLDASSSSAARNRILRRWLEEHRASVVGAWAALGFPASPCFSVKESIAAGLEIEERPSASGTPNVVRKGQIESSPAVGASAAVASRASAYAGVAVFDFDQTLTVKHVGVFEDMGQAEVRVFGGPERVSMLRAMLDRLLDAGAAIVMVSRNSRHVVSKALQSIGFLEFIAYGFEVTRGSRLIFGFEDYEDETPKSKVILQRVLRPLALSASALLFVDDDSANIKDVREQCPGAVLVQPPRFGMGSHDCEAVSAWAQELLMSCQADGALPTAATRPIPGPVLLAAAQRRRPSRNRR